MMFFSIIVPLYNKERFILNTLESLLSQTLSDYELIIIDDQSSDESYQLTKQFLAKHDLNYRLLQNEINRGVGYSRNRGISIAKGQYLIFLDADDVLMHSDFFEQVQKHLKTYDIDYLIFQRLKDADKVLPFFEDVKPFIKLVDNQLCKILDLSRFAAYGKFPFGGSGSCVLKRALVDNKRFNEELTRYEDWLFFMPIYLQTEPYFLKFLSITIGYDENSLSKQKKHVELSALYYELDSSNEIKLRKMFFWHQLIDFLDYRRGFTNNIEIIWRHKRLIVSNLSADLYIIKKNFNIKKILLKSIFKKRYGG